MMKIKCRDKWTGEELTVRVEITEYCEGATGIRLWDDDGPYPVPYASPTAYIPGLAADEVAVRDYAENEGMLKTLVEGGVVEPPHRTVPSGYVILYVCRLKVA